MKLRVLFYTVSKWLTLSWAKPNPQKKITAVSGWSSLPTHTILRDFQMPFNNALCGDLSYMAVGSLVWGFDWTFDIYIYIYIYKLAKFWSCVYIKWSGFVLQYKPFPCTWVHYSTLSASPEVFYQCELRYIVAINYGFFRQFNICRGLRTNGKNLHV
jgi:hypothetical protein